MSNGINKDYSDSVSKAKSAGKILNPCPFCKSKAVMGYAIRFDGKAIHFKPSCIGKDCGAEFPAFIEIDDAITAWNRRSR
jgi:hypothetical protein